MACDTSFAKNAILIVFKSLIGLPLFGYYFDMWWLEAYEWFLEDEAHGILKDEDFILSSFLYIILIMMLVIMMEEVPIQTSIFTYSYSVNPMVVYALWCLNLSVVTFLELVWFYDIIDTMICYLIVIRNSKLQVSAL